MDDLNKKIYSGAELDNWRRRAGEDLIPAERYILEKYLTDKDRKVIEAGTGGGRIAFNIERMGFSRISAFDYVPGMIEYAMETAKSVNSKVNFFQGDAVDLQMINDNDYFYSVYLQQIICFVPAELIPAALAESYRIISPGGTAVFSFLYFDGKKRNRYLALLLGLLRRIRGESLSRQQLPWLILNRKFNWSFLRKNQPVNYWFTREEIASLLVKTGYTILELKTSGEILNSADREEGMIYVACKK